MSESAGDDLAWFEHCRRSAPPHLSDAGATRRAAMRDLLTRRVVRRRRVRRGLQAGVALALAGTLVAGLAWAWPARQAPTNVPTYATPTMRYADLSLVRASVAAAVEIIHDDETSPARVAVPRAATLEATAIDDAELFDLLRATSHPQGFVRVGATVLLASELEQ